MERGAGCFPDLDGAAGVDREREIEGAGGEVERVADADRLGQDEAEAIGKRLREDGGDKSGGGAFDAAASAEGIGRRHANAELSAEVDRRERVAVGRGAGDRDPVAEPLVGTRGDSVVVGEGVGDRERVVDAGARRAPARACQIDDRHGAREGTVDVDDSACGSTCGTFGGATGVELRDADADHGADVGLGEGVGRRGRAGDRRAVSQPLGHERAEAVGVGERARDREEIPFAGRCRASGAACRIGDRQCPGHRGVEIDDGRRGDAGERFDRPAAVGHPGADADRGADVGGDQRVGRCGRPADLAAGAEPLEGDRCADAVGIDE